jgi:predicted nucleic acid-binding protein
MYLQSLQSVADRARRRLCFACSGVHGTWARSGIESQIVIEAAQISRELKLAMADSIILATARLNNATLWTQDEHFKNLDGVKYIEKKY